MLIRKKALIMVDLQNDFCRGGHLAVPKADEIIPIANQLQPYFDLIIATQDWHPQDHMSFASNHPDHGVGDILVVDDIPQVLWPDHCVQGTNGAELHAALDKSNIKHLFYKGTDKKIDSYSAFYDNAHKRSTGLDEYLRNEQVQDVYIMGLATDYCVKYSSIDAVKLGFNVYIIADACRGVELHPGDIENAFEEMQSVGVKIVNSKDLVKAN